ncbi:cell division topological specificity factor MinE [bacterium]|nr:cell division topological specificity factor MinE [bacterium]
MGLFTDFYNTVARFFRPQEDETVLDNSKSVATNRLKLVLMQDRTNLTPKVLEQMRSELIDLLSKYLEMDKDMLELNFEHEGDQVALMLSIPVIRAKDEDEIEETLKENNEVQTSDNNNSENAEDIEEAEETADKKEEDDDEDKNNNLENSSDNEVIEENNELEENNEKNMEEASAN